MPSYPTPSDYQEAIQFPEDAFIDPVLQSASPDESALGLPQPITGNFAAVFPMTTRAGRRWAVKCFLTDVPDQQARYQAIADHLAAADLPYTVAFDYQVEGIRIAGETFPVLKMAWAEGRPLNRFVAAHLDDLETLGQLAERWAEMLPALAEANVVHGDLQHGNVLVRRAQGDIRLTLVDYDTMHVPALAGRASPEVGHRNYQHPDRTAADTGPFVDRFAGLVVFTALRACMEAPVLWDRFDTGENLLFRSDDFYAPSASALFEALAQHDALRPLVDALRTACLADPASVPTLADVRAGAVATRWFEAPPVRRRSPMATRSGRARWFLPVALCVCALALIGGLLGGWLWAAVVLGVGLGFGGWSSWRGYRQQAIVRRRRRLDEEIAHFDALIAGLKRQITSLQAKRRDVHDTVEERRTRRLEELREAARYDRLKHHFIGEIRGVEGLTHKHVVRLKKAGVRTAYEAKPEHLAALRTLGEQAQARIAMWRSALLAEHEAAIPDELSPAEEQRIRRYVERRTDELEAEIARARGKMEAQAAERAAAQERRAALPLFTYGHYLAYLLRLTTLPRMKDATATASPRGKSVQHESVPAPVSGGEEAPWWLS